MTQGGNINACPDGCTAKTSKDQKLLLGEPEQLPGFFVEEILLKNGVF